MPYEWDFSNWSLTNARESYKTKMNSAEPNAPDVMMCNVCKKMTITPPGGFYMCDNSHMQCTNCYELFKKLCGICNSMPKYYPYENAEDEAMDKTLTPAVGLDASIEFDDILLDRTIHEDYDNFNAVE